MNIQETNEELRTKLSNLLQEKNSLWVQIEKLAAGLLQMKNFLFKIKKKKRAAELIINKELTFQNKEKEKRQQN
jgi:hypothetical protein